MRQNAVMSYISYNPNPNRKRQKRWGTSGHIDSLMYKQIWERYFSTP
jgi:hypothetical protein